MKLKFMQEIQQTIDEIANMAMYEEGDKAAEENFTVDLCGPLNRLYSLRSLCRPRLSYEYAFICDLLLRIKRSQPTGVGHHSAIIKEFKSVQDGTALADIGFLAMALSYGVIHLSDYELRKLMEGNKIQQDKGEEDANRRYVQVTGCKHEKDDQLTVVPFVSHSEAEFYGVYIGKPGAYRFISDYPTYSEAMFSAAKYVESGEARKISDKTFH